MSLPAISLDAQELLRTLLEWDEWATIAPGLKVVQVDIETEDNGRTIAALRELARTEVDVNMRPAEHGELADAGIPWSEGATVVTSARVLHIEAELSPADTPGEPVSVWVSLGRSIPRETLQELAAAEATS